MDESGFRDFYERTARPLWSYLYHVVGDAALADDLLQEAFLRVLKTPHANDPETELRPYLFKTAGNLASDHFRRLKRERRWRFYIGRRSEMHDENRELRHDVAKTLQDLKPRERTLLWLAYVEGFDHREIAEFLSLGEKSIRVLLARARAKLARLIQGNRDDDV